MMNIELGFALIFIGELVGVAYIFWALHRVKKQQ